MKVLVTGARDWKDESLIWKALGGVSYYFPHFELVVGDCRGVDKIAADVATKLRCKVHQHSADWELFGKAAGPMRNQEMLDSHDIDLVLAFHEELDKSRGTKDMVIRAKMAGIFVIPIASVVDLAGLETALEWFWSVANGMNP